MTDNLPAFQARLKVFQTVLTPDAVKAVTTALFLAAVEGVVFRTPVDTGRLRGNWQSSVGEAIETPTPRVDTTGAGPIAEAAQVAVGAPAFTRLVVANSLPYAIVVERGGYEPPNPPTDEKSLRRRAWSRSARDRGRAQLVGGHPGAPLVSGGYSLQAPRGMVAVTLAELSAKADQIIASAAGGVRR